MIKSMTGYGAAEAVMPSGKLTVEIKTLNGKNADINIKTNLLPKDKELYVRQLLADRLTRGTIDFFITYTPNAADTARVINAELVKAYFAQLDAIRTSMGLANAEGEAGKLIDNEMLAAILRFPDIMDTTKTEIISQESWSAVEEAISKAIEAVDVYRANEGVALYGDVTSRVGNILRAVDEVEKFENERIETVKARLIKNLEELQQKPEPNRFEQELIFYIEKLDINEEKVRLRQHCQYFMDTIDTDPYPGKKLGFIIQEMGREINTTGSKANHAGIQKTVVGMKEELEKIREQSLNIL